MKVANEWGIYFPDVDFLPLEVCWIGGCMYGMIIFCLKLLSFRLLAVLGGLPKREQQNYLCPQGQAPTLPYLTADPPSQSPPHHSLLALLLLLPLHWKPSSLGICSLLLWLSPLLNTLLPSAPL